MSRPAPETTIAAELRRNRARMFVGRTLEKQLFSQLMAPAGNARVLFIHGIGGVGKTTLLNEFERLAHDQSVPALWVNARDLPSTPNGLQRALSFFAQDDSASTVRVLLLDNFEYLAPLEAWFREHFLTQLPEGRRVVIAGRTAPAPAWSTDPGWATLVNATALNALPTEQAREYLQRRGVPADRRPPVLTFARGHPLALALAAEVLERQPAATLPPQAELEILEQLMAQLLRGIDDAEQLQALRAAAIVRQLTEPLLAHMLGHAQVTALFDWLQKLSFIQSKPGGLILHSLLRDAITSDLRRRDPARYDQMAGRAYRFLLRQMAARPPAQCGPSTVDVFFVQRDTPLAQTIYRFEDERHCYCDEPTDAEWPQIRDMVLKHEGEDALQVLRYWRRTQPDGLVAIRYADQNLAGFLYKLELNGLGAEAAAADPLIARYLDYMARFEPLQDQEHAILVRSWMATDTYQALSAVQTQVCAYILFSTLTTPNIAYVMHLQPDVESWTRVSAQSGQTRLPGPAVTIGRYRTALYAHDYRDEPPLQWMCGLNRVWRGLSGPAAATIDQPAFTAAVRQALKDYDSPHALAGNLLLQCALVVEHPDAVAQDRTALLQSLLRGHCERLQASPKTLPLYEVLHRTYLEPARNQALAADALYLTERTYRRRLAKALSVIAASLWLAENGDPAST